MPTVNAQMSAQLFNIFDKMGGGVVTRFAMGLRTAGAALIKKDDFPAFGIEKTAVRGLGSGARAAMKKDHRHTLRVAAYFPVEIMNGVNFQPAGLVRFDGRKKFAPFHPFPFLIRLLRWRSARVNMA